MLKKLVRFLNSSDAMGSIFSLKVMYSEVLARFYVNVAVLM